MNNLMPAVLLRTIFLLALSFIDSTHQSVEQSTQPGQYPWTVRLAVGFPRLDRKAHCSGTLVAKQWVLTSAFCIKRTESLIGS